MAQTRGSRNGESENPTMDRLASMAHDTVDRVAEAATQAEREVRTAASRTAAQAKQMREDALERADENLDKVRSYVEANPLMSAGIAFVAGIVVTSLLRR